MLLVKDTLPSTDIHEFKLSSVLIDDSISFSLTSETYAGVDINFTLEYPKAKIPSGYSVTVHLFKNKHFSQKDIIDLRVNEIEGNNGKIGYFFRLDALFEKDVLQLNSHIYPYAYYAIEHLFSFGTSLQTKTYELNSNPAVISDFFDEDTIILVICNEYANVINNFTISNYLAPLFLNGFVKFENTKGIDVFNENDLIKINFNGIKNIAKPNGSYVLRLTSPIELLTKETFIPYLYQYLLQYKSDSITRFITLYQIIEISISKIFHLKVQTKVCANLTSLTSFQLKEFLGDIQKEKTRIVALFNDYARPSALLENKLKEAIIDFFIHVIDPAYSDPAKNAEYTLAEVFYDYRNKLVHNYRLIHTPGIDNQLTQNKMELINDLTEIFISQIISNFKTA
jgi:hypothetical protein